MNRLVLLMSLLSLLFDAMHKTSKQCRTRIKMRRWNGMSGASENTLRIRLRRKGCRLSCCHLHMRRTITTTTEIILCLMWLDDIRNLRQSICTRVECPTAVRIKWIEYQSRSNSVYISMSLYRHEKRIKINFIDKSRIDCNFTHFNKKKTEMNHMVLWLTNR